MKLVRETMEAYSDSKAVRGTWLFTIEGTEAERDLVERAAVALSNAKVEFYNEGAKVTRWGDLGDGCPDYEGDKCLSMGFWVPSFKVDEFKAAWKQVKKSIK